MKLALISDIHSNRKHLKHVLRSIANHEVDHIYCLGDIFECKVSKKKVEQFTFMFVDQIVDADPKLYRKMQHMSCIIGNQEQRIHSLVPLHEVDAEMRYYLTLPPAIELEYARLEHGHSFVNEKDWAPYPKKMRHRLLFFGHTHESGLYRLTWTGKKWLPTKQEIEFGIPYQLDPAAYWGINVGAVVSNEPEWLLYEETSQCITFFREPALIE